MAGTGPEHISAVTNELREQAFINRLVIDLQLRSSSVEYYEVPERGLVYSFHNPDGIETSDLLDSEHLPQVTKFTDLVISLTFSGLRSESSQGGVPVVDIGGDIDDLKIISGLGNKEESYANNKLGRKNRKKYSNSMANSARKLYENEPIRADDVIVPVARCGENIADKIGIDGLVSEAKRLRFDGFPNLLGAGGNFTRAYMDKLEGKRVRLLEGCVASGSTEILYIAAVKNWDVSVKAVECDAVIVCPAGARLVSDFRRMAGFKEARDRGIFVGGVLSTDWYIEYEEGDRLPLSSLSGIQSGFQVLGDGGDLTSK